MAPNRIDLSWATATNATGYILRRNGTTVGTPSYLSPEACSGEAVGPAADQYSLGIVGYEMVTGQLPFRGGHDMAILYSVVNEEPQPVEKLNPQVPAAVAVVGAHAAIRTRGFVIDHANVLLGNL